MLLDKDANFTKLANDLKDVERRQQEHGAALAAGARNAGPLLSRMAQEIVRAGDEFARAYGAQWKVAEVMASGQALRVRVLDHWWLILTIEHVGPKSFVVAELRQHDDAQAARRAEALCYKGGVLYNRQELNADEFGRALLGWAVDGITAKVREWIVEDMQIGVRPRQAGFAAPHD